MGSSSDRSRLTFLIGAGCFWPLFLFFFFFFLPIRLCLARLNIPGNDSVSFTFVYGLRVGLIIHGCTRLSSWNSGQVDRYAPWRDQVAFLTLSFSTSTIAKLVHVLVSNTVVACQNGCPQLSRISGKSYISAR